MNSLSSIPQEFSDVFSGDDLIKYKHYIESFKCGVCRCWVEDDFKYCSTCERTTCNKCKCLNSWHTLKIPRHIITIVEKIKFKCKYCGTPGFKYFELWNHIKGTCALMMSKSENGTWSTPAFPINSTEKEGRIDTNHTPDTRAWIDDFVEYYNNTNDKLNSQIDNFYSHLQGGQSNKLVPYLNELCFEEKELACKKHEMEEHLKSICYLIQTTLADHLIKQKHLNIENTQAIAEWENEGQALINNIIDSNFPFKTDNGNCEQRCFCSKCEKEITNVNTYYCTQCTLLFCKETCARKCVNISCVNYLCPLNAKPCSWCNKYNYCLKCLEKCFYINCKNSFCSECYKINQHQKREEFESCNVVPCEICSKNMCIMQSVHCKHCDKRICIFCWNEDSIHKTVRNKKTCSGITAINTSNSSYTK